LNPPKKVDKHQRPHEEVKLKKGESFHIDEKTKQVKFFFSAPSFLFPLGYIL